MPRPSRGRLAVVERTAGRRPERAGGSGGRADPGGESRRDNAVRGTAQLEVL
jgi:hypothetical protein